MLAMPSTKATEFFQCVFIRCRKNGLILACSACRCCRLARSITCIYRYGRLCDHSDESFLEQYHFLCYCLFYCAKWFLKKWFLKCGTVYYVILKGGFNFDLVALGFPMEVVFVVLGVVVRLQFFSEFQSGLSHGSGVCWFWCCCSVTFFFLNFSLVFPVEVVLVVFRWCCCCCFCCCCACYCFLSSFHSGLQKV